MEQARVAMVHAFDLKYKKSVAQILPYGIYTIPECSMAGETEEALIEQKIPYIAGRASYTANARGQIIGDNDGFLKLLFRAERHEAPRRPRHRRAGDRARPRRPDGSDARTPTPTSSSTPATITPPSPTSTNTRPMTPWAVGPCPRATPSPTPPDRNSTLSRPEKTTNGARSGAMIWGRRLRTAAPEFS